MMNLGTFGYFSMKIYFKSFIQALDPINFDFSRISYDFSKLTEKSANFLKTVKLHCTELYCTEIVGIAKTTLDNQQNLIKGTNNTSNNQLLVT